MWRRIPLPEVALLLMLLALAPLRALAEEPTILSGETRWSGEVKLSRAVQVNQGATLIIAPGTRIRPAKAEARLLIRGLLKAQGTSAAPIVFAGTADWQGIEFYESDPASIIEQARFEKAATAISSLSANFTVRGSTFRNCGTAIKLLREASPLIESSTFADNRIGIDNEMKSAPTIRGNRFSGHKETAILASHNGTGPIENNHFEKNRQGIGLMQRFQDRITGNRFVENGTAIFCNQTQATPLIRNNQFEKNDLALVNFSFSYPLVEHNRFSGNRIAIRNDHFGSPLVSHNSFTNNETALSNQRKSNPKLQKNLLKKNGLAIFCDYSSYPLVKQNNFVDNTMAVKLGDFQSADWEKKAGSKKIVMEKAQERQSQNPLLAKAPTQFEDFVDVRDNWWGAATAELARAGAEGNLPFFYDRQDKRTVTYEGFGKEAYLLDRVLFHPWLSARVADAGPKEAP